MNHIDLMGRLTRDPEFRTTAAGTPVALFTLAVDRRYASKDGGERTADFIDCVAWRQTGEFISKYFRKGQMLAISGSLQIREWTDKDGNKRRTAEVNCESAYFTESRRSKEETGKQAEDFPVLDTDEELPF